MIDRLNKSCAQESVYLVIFDQSTNLATSQVNQAAVPATTLAFFSLFHFILAEKTYSKKKERKGEADWPRELRRSATAASTEQ